MTRQTPSKSRTASQKRLELLVGLARDIAATLDLEVLLQRAFQQLAGIFPPPGPGHPLPVESPGAGAGPQGLERLPQRGHCPDPAAAGRIHTREVAAALRGELQPENARLFATALEGRQIRSNICAPLRTYVGELIGTLTIGSTRARFTQGDLALLEGVAGQLAQAIANMRLYEAVQQELEERRQMEKTLRLSEERHRVFAEMTSDYVYVLRIEEDGRPLVEWASESIARILGHTLEDLQALPTPFENVILQEGLNNVERHAAAHRVQVRLRQQEGWAMLELQDDGRGFAAEAALGRQGMGLVNMAERARLLGGEARIESAPGKGTLVQVRVPLATVARGER